MSLTSQLEQKNSPVRMFFQRYEEMQGAKECLAELQSSKPIRMPPYEPASRPVWGFIGTTTDYLIRYVANKNKLDFDQTIAKATIFYANESPFSFPRLPQDKLEIVNTLWEIARTYLDGRQPDESVVYSATALSMLDNVFRSGGRIPQSFMGDLTLAEKERMDTLPTGYSANEKEAMVRFYEYFCNTLGGRLFAQDVLAIIETFSAARYRQDDEMFGATITVFNRALGNSSLVGGADFDCVISKADSNILTDIKTTIKPLPINGLRQLIGYALLHDAKKDKFDFDQIGIYFSRSGSLRCLPTATIIQKCFPSLGTIDKAKKAFLQEIQLVSV